MRPECGPEEAATQYHVLGNWNFENVVSGIEGLDEAVASDL